MPLSDVSDVVDFKSVIRESFRTQYNAHAVRTIYKTPMVCFMTSPGFLVTYTGLPFCEIVPRESRLICVSIS